jgi:multidrug efflux pump
MKEVTGPIIATALVLCAVFIPTAFISGLSGQFYKQFAVTIAISTVISAINSLTLSPALSALLLKSHHDKKDLITKAMDLLLGWFFRPFNRFFEWSSNVYVGIVKRTIRFSIIALMIYGGLVWATWRGFQIVPEGFVPAQDKAYLIGFAQLPEGSSLDRTDAVMRRMSEIALKQPGVKDAIAFPGLSIHGFSASPNSGIVFVGLKDFEERKTPELNSAAIAGALNGQFMGIQDAFVLVLPPPPVNGIGTAGGFKMMIEDRGDRGYEELYKTTQGLIGAAMGSGKFGLTYTGYTVNVPQLEADVDREKAKSQGVPLANLYETLQINLGSLYVNDFNRFGRTYQVVAQAEQQFRDEVGDITRLKTRNVAGDMVPIGSLVKVNESFGPDRVFHYNGYLAADISGSPLPPLSSGQGEDLIANLVKESLPGGFEFEWTDLTFQKIIAGNTAIYIYPLCILLVFMVLAAQYESLRLPLAIILIVPICLLFALAGVHLMGGDNNIFTQIGFIVLIGLACKNAILIVEFAKENYDHGKTPLESALDACRLRLRPILMTSIAFIAGVYPLVVSTGAGAEMRRAMGTAVFSGMIGVTFLGLFLTPVFYVLVMKIGRKKKPLATAELPAAATPTSH